MPHQGPVRVAIANDYEIVVCGVAAVLAPYADRVEIVELDARKRVLSNVDVVLYDTFAQVQGDSLNLDDLAGSSGGRVLVFSWNVEPDLIARAFDARIAGYLSKGATALEVVEAIERVRQGERVVPALAAADGNICGRWPGDDVGITARESEVFALLCQGLTNEEIGQRAFIGVNTVKTHVRRIYRTVGVTSRSQAIVWGLGHGFGPDSSRLVLED